MKKTILFVEPLFYGVHIIKEAKKMNHFTVAIVSSSENPKEFGYTDYYDDFIIADTKDGNSIYQAIISSKYRDIFDALIPATDYVTVATAEAAELLSTKGTPYCAAICARNKDKAKEVFMNKNIPTAHYCKVSDIDEAISAINQIGYPVVLKPSNACGSQNVFFIEKKADLIEAFKKIDQFEMSYLDYKINKEYLIEEFLSGPEFSVELFIKDCEILFAEVTEKITTDPPYFVELFHVFPSSVMDDKSQEMIALCHKAVLAVGFVDGPTHVEVKYTKTGPKIIEINGRPGGDNITSDLIYNAYGVNIFKEMVHLYLGEDLNLVKKFHKASSVGYISADKRGVFKELKGLHKVIKNGSVTRYEIEATPFMSVDIPKESDDRLGYIIVTEKNSKEAKKSIQSLIQKLEVVYEPY